jgi:sulfur-oxidizing protein SoxY
LNGKTHMSETNSNPPMHATRRTFLKGSASLAGGLALVPLVSASPARATPEAMKAAIKAVVGEASLRPGKIKLDMPPLVENGNSVTILVTVESPMTKADHVRAIHVFNEKNPQPNVVSFFIGPRAGRAAVSTRIRLADSQTVVAIAEMSDGTFWRAEADVVVTIAACLEGAI